GTGTTSPSLHAALPIFNEETAVLMVRPRGWHLPEKNIEIGWRAASGSLVDFGLYFFHNAKELIARGSGPYFYFPKLESHLQARLDRTSRRLNSSHVQIS